MFRSTFGCCEQCCWEHLWSSTFLCICFQFIGYMPSIRTVQMNSRILRGTSKWLFILYAVIFFSSPSLSLPFPSLPFTYLFLVPRLTARTPQPNPPPGTSGQPSDLLDENKRSCHASRAHRPSFTVLTAQKAHGKQPKKKKLHPGSRKFWTFLFFSFFPRLEEQKLRVVGEICLFLKLALNYLNL